MTEREILGDTVSVRLMHDSRAAQTAAALRVLGLHQVTPARALAQHFAAGCDLEPFRDRFLGLNAFGTSHNRLFLFPKERAI